MKESVEGQVIVVRAGRAFEVLAPNDMGETVFATPAISRGTLYVRTRGHVYAIGAPRKVADVRRVAAVDLDADRPTGVASILHVLTFRRAGPSRPVAGSSDLSPLETIRTGTEMSQKTLRVHFHHTVAASGVALALAAGLISLTASPALGQAGPEQTKKLVKSVEKTDKTIDETRQQLKKTVAGYNSIMAQQVKDTKDAYKGLGKDIDKSEKKVAEARLKVDEMNAEAERHFTAWKESAAAIKDPAQRKRSEQDLAAARARFQKVATAGKDTRQTFDTLMTDLKKQSTTLGSDLNTDTISTLKPNAIKFNTRAETLFDKIDGANKTLEDYVASMKQ